MTQAAPAPTADPGAAPTPVPAATLSTHPSFDAHEQVVALRDEAAGLVGFIAVHSTHLGPGAGGCRMNRFDSLDAALTDALRLSQGMSYKNAMAGLPAGGGKAVLMKLADGADRAAAFEAFGRAVEALGGAYVTAEDVGVSVADMQTVARATRYVAGLPPKPGFAGGDPSPWTALGVFEAAKAALGGPVAGKRFAVQGLGAVGYKLCALLHQAGARLVVADINAARVADAARDFGAETASVEDIIAADADVYSPNALGAVINSSSIARLQAGVVCGGANNQLATPADGQTLFDRGVIYAPDYVANGGGIINVMAEYLGEAADSVEARVLAIGPRMATILARSKADARPANLIADEMARDRIGRGRVG